MYLFFFLNYLIPSGNVKIISVENAFCCRSSLPEVSRGCFHVDIFFQHSHLYSVKSKPRMLKVSIYRLRQSWGALFQQSKSYLQLMAKSWPHEKKRKKKSKSITTSHSALLLARTRSKMTEFSLYSQETRQFTWCHKLCRAQLDVIFSDVGHWLENCEMRARWFLLAPEKVKVQQQDPCWHNASAF